MLRILHINSNYLTSRLHENLIDRLESDQLHNTIFMPIKVETKNNFLYKSKYEVYSPVTFRDMDKFFFTYKQNKIYKKLLETVIVEDYDVIHAHTLFTDGNVAYKLNRDYGIPYAVTIRGYTDIDNFWRKRKNLNNRGRQILKNASKVIFLSETNKNDLLENYIKSEELYSDISNKYEIIPNGIDDFYFENEGSIKTLDINEPVKFIQVGKVFPVKNALGSIKGIKLFEENSKTNVKLSIVGKILDEQYALKLKNEGKDLISYHEPVPMEELIEVFRQHDIFIMPSFSETFGLVYPEAMSQGLPVIYTKGQGFDGQFEDGVVGYPVDPHNPEDIAEKIKLIINNYTEISKNAIKSYRNFNWDKLSKNYLKLYFEISTKDIN